MRPINPMLVGPARLLLQPLFRFGFRLRREGRHHIPEHGAVLLVSNHISNLDPPLVGVAQLPGRLYFMAKKELFRGPLGWYIARCGAFPVDRGGADREAFRTAKEVLAAGERLLMFPEGTRSRDGQLRPAWPGAGSLALADGVTVIPVAIWGSPTWWRTGVTVRFGPPITFDDLTGSRGARSQAAANRMMEHIGALLPEGSRPTTKDAR